MELQQEHPLEDVLYHRYSRQVLFRPIGQTGQEKLWHSRVAVVGLGALGTVQANQLVRGGVGFVRLIDRDIVDASNLQRQSLYDEQDARLGRAKADAAAEKLHLCNSSVALEAKVTDLTWRNAEALLADVDVIVDGTDNFEVRYLINDVAVKHGMPWSYGGAVSSYGTTAFFQPGATACLACLFGDSPPAHQDTCDTLGVLAPVVSVIASLQVAEVLKFLTGNNASLSRQLAQVDVWNNDFTHVQMGPPKAGCRCCQAHEFSWLKARGGGTTVSLCGRQTVQVRPEGKGTLSLDEIAVRLAGLGQVRQNGSLLRFELDGLTLTLFQDGRALIHGTEDPAVARNLYARYIGM
ncbi:thiazole biosynthesis adenylyltransferase ThiF [Alicyclobacillaceae bacterium I2511]|nr:thiazole biosynthesis adenylyltransferase ThiF [Alicyclobacillaceae bacterium I2511]